jgi:hypothetical protein
MKVKLGCYTICALEEEGIMIFALGLKGLICAISK